jgi:ABC-type lipoprotein export system ATPase subunit
VTGPSGSGKSTLLHILAGLDEPTVGSIDWPALGGPPRTRRAGTVGVVFQGPSLLPTLDALENVALAMLLSGADDQAAQLAAEEALDLVELSAFARLLPEELSGGQAQRVAVARALVTKPAFIVADEPTGQLDRVAALAVLDALDAAAEHTHAALVVSTHDPAIAERFALRWSMTDGGFDAAAA